MLISWLCSLAKALVKALKLKDRAVAGNLGFRDSSGSRDVHLVRDTLLVVKQQQHWLTLPLYNFQKLVFEEDEVAGSSARAALSRPVSKNKMNVQWDSRCASQSRSCFAVLN